MNQFESDILKIFAKAPQSFYNPCGRQFLTFSEVETRKYLAPASIKISDKEIVFRKFWEISQLDIDHHNEAINIVYIFLKDININKELATELLLSLKSEITTLLASNNRILHNPF